MKRMIFLLLIFYTILLFSSCEEHPIETTSDTTTSEHTEPYSWQNPKPLTEEDYGMDSPYIFHIITTETAKLQLIQYDLVNKTASVVCFDAECDHTRCPATSVERLKVTDDYVYWNSQNSIYVYDIKKQEIRKIFSVEHQSYYVDVVAGRAYFCSSYKETGEELWHLYRYDPETDDIKRLTDAPLADICRYEWDQNGRITWEIAATGERFSTDLDFQNRGEAEEFENPIPYEYDLQMPYAKPYTLKRRSKPNSEWEEICKDTYCFRMLYLQYHVIGYLYVPTQYSNGYTSMNQIMFVDGKDPTKTKILWDGTNQTEFTLSDSGLSERGQTSSSGVYETFQIVYHFEDENGVQYVTQGLLVLNWHTGESFTIKADVTKRSP